MSFNFSGTFTTAQFQELAEFARVQERDLKGRASWLRSELLHVGIFTTVYDRATNMPVRFSVTPPGSHGEKLLRAYKILGGVPENDMLLRTSDKPVFLSHGTSVSSDPENPTSGYSDVYSNGRRHRGTQRFDRDLGLRVERFKSWQLEAVKRKREHLEFKIKRALDYSDQLQIEMKLLDGMLNVRSGQSVEDQITKINQLMFRPGAMNVVQDMSDRFGLGIGRPGDKTVQSDLDQAVSEKMRV